MVLTSVKQYDEFEQLSTEAEAAALYMKRHLDIEVVHELIENRHQQVMAA